MLSDLTEADGTNTFRLYQTIPTFQEYTLINPAKVETDPFFKTGAKRWLPYEYDHEDAELSLKSFDLQIPTINLYDKILFEEILEGQQFQTYSKLDTYSKF